MGAVLVAVAVVTFLALVTGSGSLTELWVGFLQASLGWGVVLSPLIIGGLGAWLIAETMEGRETLRWERPAGALLLLLVLLALVHISGAAAKAGVDLRRLAEDGAGGGWIGYGVANAFVESLGTWPGIGALIVLGIVAASLVAGLTLRETGALAGRAARGTLRNAADRAAGLALSRSRFRLQPSALQPDEEEEAQEEARQAQGVPVQRAMPKPARSEGEEDRPKWRLPPLDEVFEPAHEAGGSPEDAEAMARLIIDTLAEFGIPVEVIEINRGPTVTQFGLEPGYIERAGKRSKVKVSRITSLQNDLALALAASPIRIQAPVPGRPYVGVEVPNSASSLVSLRGVVESEAFERVAERGVLPMALGRDTSGRAVAADLASMPHLLVAGATGSGKSVAINSIISALVTVHTPETLKLLLIDPKRVELASFRGMPHLAAPVVVEIDRVVGVLQWSVREMDRRYKAFAEIGARNIASFNAMAAERRRDPLPYIVIIVDELADLMMTVPEEAERLITRLAQLARATGIHLVIATQRPSVDVVTGLIKANFPSRIAFAVSSSVDSRVILDSVGAEKLLGRGDMLYQASDSSKLRRLQGCFVSDREIERLTRFWKRSARPSGPKAETSLTLGLPAPLIQPELWDAMGEQGASAVAEKRDELWDEAVRLIKEHETASTSFLQRKLRIGYSRAARLVDQLEEEGLVSPAKGNQPREVLVGAADPGEGAAARAEDEVQKDGRNGRPTGRPGSRDGPGSSAESV